MEPEINHDLDIDGDVLLVLQNPNEPFAVWNEEEDWELSRPKRRGTTSLEESFTIKLYRVVDPACESYHRSLVDPAPESAERDEPRRKKLKSSPSSVTSGSPEVRFRLSSRHLILASPYFRAMLTGPWAENSSRAGSMYIASASDWDDGALTILMDIIHGHSERIPSSMSLELLAKIAVLVDYYKCHKIVKSYSDTWIEGTLGRGETNLPQRYSRDLILCLFIACVFAQHKITEDLTRILVRKSRGPVRTLGLPFPDGLLGLWSTLPLDLSSSLTLTNSREN